MTFTQGFLKTNFPIIGQDKLSRTIEGLKNSRTFNRVSGMPRSNTAVFAIKYDQGIIMAGDRRTSDGNLGILSDDTVKVKKISNFSVLACAGDCSVISYLEENMSVICAKFSRLYKRELSPDGQASYLKHVLEGWWYVFLTYWFWQVGVPVLATYDLALDKPRIFWFSEDGFYWEPDYLAGTGCGWDAVKNIIREYWYKKIGADETLDLAIKAQIWSGASSHGVSEARFAPPVMANLTRNGLTWIPERKIIEKIKRMVPQMGGLPWNQ